MAITPSGLLMVQMDIDPAVEEEFHRWYEDEHIPERLAVPGIVRVRRFEALGGLPKHLVLYDLDGPDVLDGPEYRQLKAAGSTPWTERMLARSSNFQRLVYRKIYDRSSGDAA